MKEPLKVTVKGCARCGENHHLLEFYAFENPIIIEFSKFTHWGVCPKLNEPILMKLVQEEGEK